MMSDEINTLLVPYQLNYSLWQVMFVIREKNGCTSIEMAEYLNVSKPSIAKRVHALSELQILTHVETEDKRQKKLILSESGESLFKQCAQEIDRFENSLIAQFEPHDIQHVVEMFHNIVRALEAQHSGDQHAN
ncbi:MarR family transcriptional regulator [Acinetobacter sp. ANC 5054]|uniref:MarR family transcriptional regulator n=1 Tax=Acinetobacter sp. ANC 5054 TaxID=1977877 RepID=UPI000A33C897|nr:MarR family transcriptional regulator [Acinetobacter sp. ANC 5054]OTG79480.1 MarR family transcriptional regulator [Acinetobacter sp. ANC 5054]